MFAACVSRTAPVVRPLGRDRVARRARAPVLARGAFFGSRRARTPPAPSRARLLLARPVRASASSDAGASGEDDPAAAPEALDPASPAPSRGALADVADAFSAIEADFRARAVSGGGSMRTLAVALAALVAIHVRDPGWGIYNNIRIAGSLLLGAGLAHKGYRGGSLDLSGAVAAALVGWGTLYAGVRFGVALGVFFFASSAMTRVGAEVKRAIDEHASEEKGKEGGARNWIQVGANGAVPTFLAMGYAFATGGPEHLLGGANAFETPLAAAFVGYYGCCAGDTWASELGVLSKTPPRLITNVAKVVKPGTNGGVTPLGLAASAAGGLAVGLAFWVGGVLVPIVTGQVELALRFAAQWPVLLIGLGSGAVGSLIDSVLGATVQFSGYCDERKRMVSKPGPGVTKVSGLNFLSNSAVNFVSAATCAMILYYGTIHLGLPRKL
jgi:uncharacterized protein (TIGR00297 family)